MAKTMFPAGTVGIALWGVATALIIRQLILMPPLDRGMRMFSEQCGLLFPLNSLSQCFTYGGSVAAFGAMLYLIGEIRDAATRPAPEKKPIRLAARKFAGVLWFGAPIVAASLWIGFTCLAVPSNIQAEQFWRDEIIGTTILTLWYTGMFAALGGVIWLLGDIRDRLNPPQ